MTAPDLLNRALERFRAEADGPEWPSMAGSVLPVTTATGQAVLKLMSVDYQGQLQALREYDGSGAVRLLDAEPELQALLLERIEPGHSALALMRRDDDAATLVVAETAKALLKPASGQLALPTYAQWAEAVARATPGAIDAAHLVRARALFADLVTSPTHLLHGDLHHDNVLQRGAGWTAIDPAGVIGEPAAECGALLRNWLPDLLEVPDPVALTSRRVAILAEVLELDAGRIRAWAYAQSVMSVCWMVEDGQELMLEDAVDCIDLLHTVWFQGQ